MENFAKKLLRTSPFVPESVKQSLHELLERIEWRGFQRETYSKAVFILHGDTFLFHIFVNVHKGSLLTQFFNIFGRLDDSYSATLRVANQERDEVDQLIWRVSGFDCYTKRVSNANLNWPLLKSLQKECGTSKIGCHCFAKLLVHALIAIPSFMQNEDSLPPMPATLMHNSMLIVESCPFVISIARNMISSKIENLIALFRDDTNGHALWIEKVQPFWTTESHHKILCSSLDAPQIPGLISMCSPDTIHDIGLRVIEIFPSSVSELGVAAVVELVHRQKWVHIVRFVVTDISSLYQLMIREVPNVDGLKKKHSLAQSVEVPVLVRIYDETEWKILCDLWQNCDTGVSEQFFNVDFRNSHNWGMHSL